MHTRILTERLDLSESRIDPDSRIIYGVVLIRAGMSRNRRFYSPDVLRASAPIFESAKAYLNHPPLVSPPHRYGEGSGVGIGDNRSLRDLSGWYANVEYRDGALYADRHFTRTAAGNDAWVVAEDIATGRAPATLAGLSINAVGQGTNQDFPDGEAFNVECITHALSVDDVSEPAAGGTYMGEEAADNLTGHLLAALTYDEWTRARPDFLRRLQKEMKAVRQDEALTAAKNEINEAVDYITELQESLAQMQIERDDALADATSARRALDIEHLLSEAVVPVAWLSDLRSQLARITGSAEDWLNDVCRLIAAEESKARAAGYKRSSVPVSGADPQIAQPQPVTVPLPVLDMNRLRTPEDLAALIKRLTPSS